MTSSSQPPADFSVIVGLGATGVSCARHLAKNGKPFAMVDTRDAPPQLDQFRATFPNVDVELGQLDADILKHASEIILSPGVALREPAIEKYVAQGVPVVGDIEVFARAVTKPVIAITGTNAKSTVTTLVGEMAKAAGYNVEVGGNLGVPVLDLLANNPDTDLFVLELSSFQLETTHSLAPVVATVLNVSPDHMDRYDDIEQYRDAKLRVYQQAKNIVCNADDAATDIQHKNKFNFTLKEPRANEFGVRVVDGQSYLAFGDKALMPVADLPVGGNHYVANALAALAIGYGFGLGFEPMLGVLKTFKGLPHRCQLVRERNGVKWFNDSKGTNVGATQAAISGLGASLNGKLVIIAGGLGKNADFSPLLPILQQYARHIVLIGEAATELADLIGDSVPLSFAASMPEAVTQAEQAAQPGDYVLLSPACASFDMFKSFEHRGEVFTQSVLGLA